jgi:hypothetical protein
MPEVQKFRSSESFAVIERMFWLFAPSSRDLPGQHVRIADSLSLQAGSDLPSGPLRASRLWRTASDVAAFPIKDITGVERCLFQISLDKTKSARCLETPELLNS